MKAPGLLFVIGLLLSVSCREEKKVTPICSVENPGRDLEWIQPHITEWEQTDWDQLMWITSATHEGQTVFIFGNCCINCASVYRVYNCAGDEIGTVGTIDPEILDRDVLVWKSEDSTCNL